MEFKKLNNYSGWLTFLIALIVYFITVEDTASFWDAGEFIAVSNKLEVPHPPGAPFYLLLGRFFSLFAFGNLEKIALAINFLSVLSSAFTVLFLFWTITHLTSKVIKTDNINNILLVLLSGLTGALSFTFTDSFWFSAVEAEVYAMSSFFTAFVFWAILRWESSEYISNQNRWIILIAYMMGLSIGVHLLNLVAIPALALIMYFKKAEKVSFFGVTSSLILGLLVVGIIVEGIIPGLPSIASFVERLFVNSFGLPFGSGIIFFIIIFISFLIYLIWYSHKKEKTVLNTSLLAFTFILIGYSSYSLVLIRSNYNPPIDENNPENILNFISYLKREQYGSRPLVKGQYFDAEVIKQEESGINYKKGEEKYEVKEKKFRYVFDPKRSTIFPRMYSNSPNHIQRYREITNLGKNEKPTFSDNLEFFFKYQIGHMYLRYFMWNFSGRSSDIQNANWLGLQNVFDEVPYQLEMNKARNNYLMIPLLLGILGLLFQYYRDNKNFYVVMLLFILTGVALVVYLNSPPTEPRERDYIYAGSYYAFSIWIGYGSLFIFSIFSRLTTNKNISFALTALISLSSPIILAKENWDDHDRSDRFLTVDSAKNLLDSCAPNSILFTGGDNDTFPLWYVQEVENFRTDVRVIVLSYFNTDWYIEQMMSKKNDSEKINFSISLDNYIQGGLNDYLPYVNNPKIQNVAINLKGYINLVKRNSKAIQVATSASNYNSIPSKSFWLSIGNTENLLPQKLNKIKQDTLFISLKSNKSGLEKKDLAFLDLLQANNWERPIYFNNTSLNGINLDLKRNVVQEGFAYRLFPVLNPNSGSIINTELMYSNIMNKSYWRELNNPNAYFSEDHRGFIMNYRSTFNTLIKSLISNKQYDKALEIIKKSIELIPDEAIMYDHFSVQLVDFLIDLEIKANFDTEILANEIAEIISQRSNELLNYYFDNKINDKYEIQKNLVSLNTLARAYNKKPSSELAKKYRDLFENNYSRSSVN
ncbi:MAG: glycosyltransferase [Rhodothermaeota bacterium MED-G16]|nr:MAG: glycosyltransferase [Rhodothermaeota bacterium MED-G16]